MRLKYVRSDDVEHHLTAGVLRVVINRPAKRNPLSLGVLRQLEEIFSQHAADPDMRMAIVTGAGDRAFASGGDLAELSDVKTPDAAQALSLHGKAALNAIRTFPVPVVAQINGIALGGGAELALACDLRFAAAHAKIGFIHSRLGISPSWGGGVDLMRLVGFAAGTRLLARAEILAAQEALTLGLFDGVAADDSSLADAFSSFIDVMRRQPPQVMRAIKALSLGERTADLQVRQKMETDHFVTTWVHPDHWTAVDTMNVARSGKAAGEAVDG